MASRIYEMISYETILYYLLYIYLDSRFKMYYVIPSLKETVYNQNIVSIYKIRNSLFYSEHLLNEIVLYETLYEVSYEVLYEVSYEVLYEVSYEIYGIVSYEIYKIVSYKIYEIDSYEIVSYEIVSYETVSYETVSYETVSYETVSYEIVCFIQISLGIIWNDYLSSFT